MITGIDISNNNAMPDIAPYDFVFLKATEGETYLDRTYVDRHLAVRNAGKVAGAYLFFRTASTAPAHVSFFATVAAILPGDVVALDFENDGTWGQFSSQALANMAIQTMNALLVAFPMNRVLLYCNLSTYQNVILPFQVPIGDGLWIAEPSGTPQFAWTFWQYGQSGIDLDYGNFDNAAVLKAWANSKGQLPPVAITGAEQIEGNMGMGAWQPEANRFHHLCFPVGPDNSLIVKAGYFSMALGGPQATAKVGVTFIGTDNLASNPTAKYLDSVEVTLTQDVRWEKQCPPNTDQIGILIHSATHEIAWCLELVVK